VFPIRSSTSVFTRESPSALTALSSSSNLGNESLPLPSPSQGSVFSGEQSWELHDPSLDSFWELLLFLVQGSIYTLIRTEETSGRMVLNLPICLDDDDALGHGSWENQHQYPDASASQVPVHYPELKPLCQNFTQSQKLNSQNWLISAASPETTILVTRPSNLTMSYAV
jgi:hypothetical protein